MEECQDPGQPSQAGGAADQESEQSLDLRDESKQGGSFSEVSTESCWQLHFPSLISGILSNLIKKL